MSDDIYSKTMSPKIESPLIQVYTGNGKGKTTAALGLAFRAAGHGFRVKILQFMKCGTYSGENISYVRLDPYIKLEHFGRECPKAISIAMGWSKCDGCGKCFVEKGKFTDEDVEMALKGMSRAKEIMENDEAELLILDEISNVIDCGILDVHQLVDFVKSRNVHIELVLTGRNMPEEVIELADLVTEMNLIKHPFDRGIYARRGIEY